MYNSSVKIANWFQDIVLEAEKVATFIKKRENGELLVQQTRRLLKNLLRATQLSKNNDNFIKFGNCVQLKAPDMLNAPITKKEKKKQTMVINNEDDDGGAAGCSAGRIPDNGIVLAGTVHVEHMMKLDISSLSNGCQLVGSPITFPCVRTTFIIASPDHNSDRRNGQNLLLGQDFLLQMEADGTNLYVRSEKPLIDGMHAPLGHYPITLSNKKDRFSLWNVLYCDSNMRFEMEGAPFPPRTRVVLRHVMTGMNLAVEGTVWYIGMFGNECGISAHKYLDGRKRETAECIWMFINGD